MTTKQRNQQNAAAKREARAAAHTMMMARHAARGEAIARYAVAYDKWVEANFTGPAPLDPRFYDAVLFPENKRAA